MYGLPKDFDPIVFEGRSLDAVTFGTNVIVLTFAGPLTVSVAGTLLFQASATDSPRREAPPVTEAHLVQAVGRTVLTADATSSRELQLQMSSGAVITLLDDSPHYESFSISLGDTEIVV